MRSKKLSIGLRAVLAMFAMTLFATSALATEKKLHNFGNGTDGAYPSGGLIFDAAGNLYGTTEFGGDYPCYGLGCGTVFELTPEEGGGWTEKVLHNFGISDKDGQFPSGPLILDAAGNLYGTTNQGGTFGAGTVFELTPKEGGGWTEKKLHNFGMTPTDGGGPTGGLIFDAAGNLYGTTTGGGVYDGGTVFELTPNGSGGWTEKKLHSFGNLYGVTDGTDPQAALIFDAAGNLYGTTTYGGDYDTGTVFELTPNGSDRWTEKKLHNFRNVPYGARPESSLVLDAAGNLYGTTRWGGDYGLGTVFELIRREGGGWTEKKLHNFFNNGTDAAKPYDDLIFDAAGNLYGTTANGGDYRPIHSCNAGSGCGTVFELTPTEGGDWTEKKLHNFGNGTDGTLSYTGLIFDASGNLYGTTSGGGDYGGGTVFEITP